MKKKSNIKGLVMKEWLDYLEQDLKIDIKVSALSHSLGKSTSYLAHFISQDKYVPEFVLKFLDEKYTMLTLTQFSKGVRKPALVNIDNKVKKLIDEVVTLLEHGGSRTSYNLIGKETIEQLLKLNEQTIKTAKQIRKLLESLH